ncbi:hypothetical protein CLOP_g3924 [Closterium sp. NIES-67]|nr:hypothetical protein CLOP_g3924 [Closterium sp. NIES-67]
MQSTTARWRITRGTWCTCQMEEANTVQVAGQIKTDEKGEPSVYKSRLVAKGFQQKEKKITKKCLPQLLSLQRYVCC